MFIFGGKNNLYSFCWFRARLFLKFSIPLFFIHVMYLTTSLLDDSHSFVFMARLVTVSSAYMMSDIHRLRGEVGHW